MAEGNSVAQKHDTLVKSLHDAEEQLSTINFAPFSVQAFGALKENIAIYISQLIGESLKVAKRHRADTVSQAHVYTASDYLVADTSRRVLRHLGTIGGIFLGAALSNVLAMATTKTFSGLGVGVTLSLGIVGAFMIAFHIARD